MKTFDALVVGHVCLDVIPEIQGELVFEPGTLLEVGPARLSPGGAVSNVGTAMDRLGIRTLMVGKTGTDEFGQTLRSLLDQYAPTAVKSIKSDPEGNTGYTIVLNLTGKDRMFLHSPGANRSFRASDVSDDELSSARLMHFGYPPLLESMYSENGKELVSLFRRAKQFGLLTSLDLTLPDKNARSGRADWKTILANVLPYVDYFLPSVEEITFMLDRCRLDLLNPSQLSSEQHVYWATEEAITLGAKNVGIKLGSKGLYFRDGCSDYWQPCFKVDVRGTTGSGDATIAGFLCGLLESKDTKTALELAAVVGACCCEASDAVSGIPARAEIEARWKQFKFSP